MGDIIYNNIKERFGVIRGRCGKDIPTPAESRRQQEIKRLIRERRQFKEQWSKASEVESRGLMQLRVNLIATLRRPKNLRKHHRQKEHTRVSAKTPFKRSLL